ncbi:MAG: ABC transporter permease [Chitinophagaceae bacterium]|nr:ABC transporter permease [Chitinophagaceae bacterium]
MIKNYFKIAWRNLVRNPTISFINIGGLAIGLSCAIILYLYAGSEFGYDSFYNKADHIYRIYTHISLNGVESREAKSSPPVGLALRLHFPEVEANTLVGYEASYNMRYGDKMFRETRVYTADSNYFKVFSHPLLNGNPLQVLSLPGQLVMTASTANRFFGTEDPIGKQILVGDSVRYTVAGVMSDFPENTHFDADMFLSMATIHGRDDNNWLALGYSNYVMLKPGSDVNALEQKLKSIVDKGAGPQIAKMLGLEFGSFTSAGNDFSMRFQPLKEIHLFSKDKYGINPNSEWGNARLGNIVYVRIFIATALLVLLIAIFNFMNISTARSQKRARETGIRKTLGSNRWQLMMQYFAEALFIAAISVLLALFIVELVIPWFNKLTGKSIVLLYFKTWWVIPLLVLFTIVVGLLAGLYPALYLSAFKPVNTLKGVPLKEKSSLRSVLVVSQFAISIALIIGMIAVHSQLNYLRSRSVGVDHAQVITITNGSSIGKNLYAFRNELLKNPAIESVTNSSLMYAAGVPMSAYTYEKQQNTEPIQASYLDVEDNFAVTFGLSLKEGRFFRKDMLTDSNSVIINETAAKAFAPNQTSILNHRICMLSNDSVPRYFNVIGVVRDFHYESLHQMVKPLVLHLHAVEQAATYISIRFKNEAPAKFKAYVEQVWSQMEPYDKCNFDLLSNQLENLYNNEKRIGALSALLSGLAVLVACMGLFGLALFVTEQRKKEIGIRKVLGASVLEVVATISGQFVWWIVLANLVAWPVAYIVLRQWLQHFAYRINPAWWMFGGAGIMTLFVGIGTVAFIAIRAAISNSVNNLRTE